MKATSQNRLIFGGITMLVSAIVLVAVVIVVRSMSNNPLPEVIPNENGVTIVQSETYLGDWTLTDTTSQPFDASQLQGKPTLLSFGFANCPDICPLTLREFQRVRRILGDQSADLNILFISVDGQRDTPQALGIKLAQSGVQNEVIGLTGDPEVVRAIGSPLGLDFIYGEPDANGDYTVGHTTSYYLLDASGRWRAYFTFGTDPAVIAEQVEELLNNVQPS